jgi:hypothetical protein
LYAVAQIIEVSEDGGEGGVCGVEGRGLKHDGFWRMRISIEMYEINLK